MAVLFVAVVVVLPLLLLNSGSRAMARRRSTSAHQLAMPALLTEQLAQLGSGDAIAGVDEVGRGALFGPVVAAAVVLPDGVLVELAAAGVTDSKLLSPEQRRSLAEQIRVSALAYRIGYASVSEIDRFNILQASLLAMRRAILRLPVTPQLCLIDGNQRVPDLPYAQQTVVKGDQKSLAIAAASIIAKVWRDDLIIRMAVKYPQYDLAANKGYGTVSHRLAIQKFGPSRYHRRSFSPCR